MYVVPEPANILAALMCALEQPHTITERGGELFIVPPPGADKMKSSATVTPPALAAIPLARIPSSSLA